MNRGRVISVLYLLAVFLLSVLKTPSGGNMPVIPFADKIAHFIIYAVMGILLLRSLAPFSRRRVQNIILVALVCSLYGLLLEFIQGFMTTTRESSVGDVAANTVGSFVGVFLGYRFERKGGIREEPRAHR